MEHFDNTYDKLVGSIDSCNDFHVLEINLTENINQLFILTLNYQHQIIEISVFCTDTTDTFKIRAKEQLIALYQSRLDSATKEVELFEKKIAELKNVGIIGEVPEIQHFKLNQQRA